MSYTRTIIFISFMTLVLRPRIITVFYFNSLKKCECEIRINFIKKCPLQTRNTPKGDKY